MIWPARSAVAQLSGKEKAGRRSRQELRGLHRCAHVRLAACTSTHEGALVHLELSSGMSASRKRTYRQKRVWLARKGAGAPSFSAAHRNVLEAPRKMPYDPQSHCALSLDSLLTTVLPNKPFHVFVAFVVFCRVWCIVVLPSR